MKLRGKLLLAIVPVVASAMLTLGFVVYGQLRADAEEEIARQTELLLVQTRERMQGLGETMEANARLFATSNLVESYVREEDEETRYELLQPALLKLFASYRDAWPAYREIRLLLPGGYEDTRLAEPGLPNLEEEEGDLSWFREALAAGGTYRSVRRSPDDGKLVMLVAHPLMIADRNVDPTLATPRLRGLLAITAELDQLERQVRVQRIGRTGHLQVLDREGVVVFSPYPSRVGVRLEPLEEASGGDGEAVRQVLHGVPSRVQRRLLGDGLELLAIVPDGEFALARRSLATTVGVLTTLVTCLVAALVFLLLSRLVLRPMYVLGHRARQIGEGRLDTVFDTDRRDEIGDLSNAFAEMSAKLEKTLGQLRGSHARIEELAFRDSLTGLPNRRMLLELVDAEILGAKMSGTRCALLYLDLDDFKRVNDTLGHDVGDELLQEAARRLERLLERGPALPPAHPPPRDRVARLGGDEFTLLLPRLADGVEAERLAADVVAALAEPLIVGGRELVVGTSVGVAVYPDDADSLERLVKCADAAMYEAKRVDGNTWRRFDADMQISLERALRLENDLRSALAAPRESGLAVNYQLQFDIARRRFCGAEALVRWQHPELGRIGPDEFVPIAERTGTIGELGAFVLAEACAQWRRWSAGGLGALRMSVNVSPRQFAVGDVQADVCRELVAQSMPPGALELELTESCMMEAPEAVVATLASMRRLGVRVAMDDFGTGHSSLAVLLTLPIDTLKIDRSFVTGLHENVPKGKVVRSIQQLAQELGLEVVAEGVETEGELAFLADTGCDLAQGYLLAAPLPAEAASALLEASREGDGTSRRSAA